MPKPVEIKKYLDEYIIGQDQAKRNLAVAETGVREDDRMTVSPARIRKLESRSFKTESGIEIKIPAELCSSDDAVEFIHSATGGLSLLIKDVLV